MLRFGYNLYFIMHIVLFVFRVMYTCFHVTVELPVMLGGCHHALIRLQLASVDFFNPYAKIDSSLLHHVLCEK